MTRSQKTSPTAVILEHLFQTIESRKSGDPGQSYTAKLLVEGKAKIAKKIGEEATETIIAATAGSAADLTRESADLLYHLLVLWSASGVAPADVWAELARREGTSGLAEKARRNND